MATSLHQYDLCRSRLNTVALMMIVFKSVSLKRLSRSFLCDKSITWGDLVCLRPSPHSTVNVCSSFLAPVRPALGSWARENSSGAQQGAGGLPTTHVCQQWGASARDRGMLVPSIVTLTLHVQDSEFIHILEKKYPVETPNWLLLIFYQANYYTEWSTWKISEMTESVTSSQLKDSTPYRSLAEDNVLGCRHTNSTEESHQAKSLKKRKTNVCCVCKTNSSLDLIELEPKRHTVFTSYCIHLTGSFIQSAKIS